MKTDAELANLIATQVMVWLKTNDLAAVKEVVNWLSDDDNGQFLDELNEVIEATLSVHRTY